MAKREKRTVDYSPGMKTRHCGVCTHFSEVAFGVGECALVRGLIDWSMWCKLFQKDKSKGSSFTSTTG
jgi:hypothetical protein